MEWAEKLEIIEEAFNLYQRSIITEQEFISIKINVLDLLLAEPQSWKEFGKVIEKDTLDGEVTNVQVKKFKPDFERINVQEDF